MLTLTLWSVSRQHGKRPFNYFVALLEILLSAWLYFLVKNYTYYLNGHLLSCTKRPKTKLKPNLAQKIYASYKSNVEDLFIHIFQCCL